MPPGRAPGKRILDNLATNLAGQFLTMAIGNFGSANQTFSNGTGLLGSILSLFRPMAHGGIVDWPTLLLAGERGAKEVRPVGGGGRGGPVEVHVFNTAVLDPGEFIARGVGRGGAPVRLLTTFHEPRNLIEKNTLRNQTRR